MNIIEKIFDLMENDSEDSEKQSAILEDFYNKAKQDPKILDLVDKCFIALCGYSLTTIIKDEDTASI